MRGHGPGWWQRAWLVTGACHSTKGLRKGFSAPFGAFHKYFKEKCSLLQIIGMLFITEAAIPRVLWWALWASDSILEKSISILHPIFSSPCVSQLVGGLLLLVLKYPPVQPLPERKHWPFWPQFKKFDPSISGFFYSVSKIEEYELGGNPQTKLGVFEVRMRKGASFPSYLSPHLHPADWLACKGTFPAPDNLSEMKEKGSSHFYLTHWLMVSSVPNVGLALTTPGSRASCCTI